MGERTVSHHLEKIRRIAKITSHFATIHGTIPGTLSRGPSSGIIFAESHEQIFDSAEHLEAFLHKRLLPHHDKPSFKDSTLILCHLDIAPRNIIWKDDGSICLLDWATAGFYPRSFEFAAQGYSQCGDEDFNRLMELYMEPLSELERAQCQAVMIARFNCEKYNL